MKNFSVRAVADGAIVTALTVVLLAAAAYVPALGMFSIFVSGIPLVYLIIKRGFRVSVISLVASMALLFALTGDIISGVFAGALSLLPSLVIGYCMKNRCRYYTTLLAGVITVLFGFLIEILMMNWLAGQNVILTVLDQSIQMVRGTLSAYMEALGDSGALSEVLSNGLEQTKNTILSYFPAIMIFISAAVGYIIVSSCIFFMNRLRAMKYEYVRFYMIKIPKSMCIVACVLMLISFFSYDSTMATLALKNVTVVLIGALAVDGMSTVDFTLRRKIRSGYMRFGIYMLVLIFGYFILSMILYLLMFLGVLDAYLDIRLLRRAGDDR